jgi:3-dehydroquinate dehydratase-2
MTTAILLLNGPNLNLLGTRETSVYGSGTLADIVRDVTAHAAARDATVRAFQSNGEGALIDALHDARTWADGVVFNAGAYTHTSIALRDAIAAIAIPVVEVHISNVHAREPFRHQSLLSGVCLGVVAGFGRHSYILGLDGLLEHLRGSR